MEEIHLPKTFGTRQDSEKEAVLLAIKENKNVIYEFQDTQHRVTLAEAQIKLPLLLKEALKDTESLMEYFFRRADEAQNELDRIMEAYEKLLGTF